METLLSKRIVQPRRALNLALATLLALSILLTAASSYNKGTPDRASWFFDRSYTPSREVLKYLKQERKVSQHHSILKSDGLELLDFDRDHIKVLYPEVIDEVYNRTNLDAVDWSKLAYVLYATSKSHMCNAMMKLAELKKFGSRAQLVMLVNQEFLDEQKCPVEYKLLTEFALQYDVRLKGTEIIQMGGDSVNIWLSSFTKLMVFNQTEYDRVVYMDSDAILTQGHVDELFFIPPCKLAVSTAYWMMKIKFEKGISDKYDPVDYGFNPLTTSQRRNRIDRLINDEITAFVDPENGYLKIHQDHQDRRSMVNEKNFYTNLYNHLPDYPAIRDFDLTNIVMVIQPSEELYERVLYAMAHKAKNEFDMELVQNRIFPLRKVLRTQWFNSPYHSPNMTMQERIEEVPEFMILPHQVYGTLTPQFNSEKTHYSYMADAHEQVFAHHQLQTSSRTRPYYYIEDEHRPGDIIFDRVKYLHFSDAPIPKPWFKQIPTAPYMGYRTRCPAFRDFSAKDGRVKPRHKTEDCSGAEHWEEAHRMFQTLRKEVCGLDLIETKEDTYHSIIN